MHLPFPRVLTTLFRVSPWTPVPDALEAVKGLFDVLTATNWACAFSCFFIRQRLVHETAVRYRELRALQQVRECLGDPSCLASV